MDPRELALEMAVVGSYRKALGNFGADFAAQLAGRRLRVGDDQKIIDVCRIDRVFDVGKKPIDQHLRLARSRRRRDKQRTAPVLHHRLLRPCQLHLSHLSSSSRASARIPPP